MTSSTSGTLLRSRAQRRRFAGLYREHFGLLWSVVRGLGIADAQREDVLQEVWLCVYRRMHTLDPGASTKAWLCSIARNVVLHHHRTGYRRSRKLAKLAAEPRETTEDPRDRHNARDTVIRILETMEPEQRSVLVLAHVHGLSGPEIAEGLGIPLNTAYSRLRLARKHVQRTANSGEFAQVERPPPEAARKTWVLLVPHLGSVAPVAASAGLWATAKIWIPAAALGTGVLGIAAAVTPASPPTAITRATVVPAAAPAPNGGPDRKARTAEGLPPAAQPVALGRVGPGPAKSLAPPENVATRSPAPARTHRQPLGSPPPAAKPVATSVPDPVEAPVGKPQPLGLEEEAKLLRRAQAALASGESGTALALLEEHLAQFPSGQLADAREGAWVRALCSSGRRDEAQARARKLAKRRPGSAVTDAVRDVCDDSI